jgi:CDP-diacylglycerol--glycerol-3-phosphate 3-phosphatidyltransferase
MFTLVSRSVFPIVAVLIIAVRELAVSVYRVLVGAKGISVPATRLAKLKTLVQQFAVAFALLPLTALDATWTWTVLLWAAVVLTVISGAHYFWYVHRRLTTNEVTGAV